MGEVSKAEQVIELIAEKGLSLCEACKQLKYSHNAFLAAIKSQGLIDEYARARETRDDMWFEEIKKIAEDQAGEIVDEYGNVRLDSGFQQRQKLRIDAIKWMLARTSPKKYGDKIDVTTDGKEINIAPIKWVNGEP